ncbi:MAG: PAS domain S-box protein, partial [Kiritimatiellia bacterium]|nr:PAS domain S-box protein [Kiritimatiellia bacterium]
GGEAAGVIVFHVDPKAFLIPLLAHWPVPSRTAECLLLYRQGDSLIFLEPPRKTRSSRFADPETWSQLAPPAWLAAKGDTRHLEMPADQGCPILCVIREIPNSSWMITARMDRCEALESATSLTWLLIGGIVGFLLIGGVFLFAQWKHQEAGYLRRTLKAEATAFVMEQHAGRMMEAADRNLARRIESTKTSERYRLFMEFARDVALIVREEDGRIVEVNTAAETLYGYSRDEWLTQSLYELNSQESRESIRTLLCKAAGNGSLMETRHMRKSGEFFPVEVSARRADIGGESLFFIAVRDISDREREETGMKELERQLRQARSLEAIGRLAGGIAHDFNNLLQVILGNAENLLSAVPSGDRKSEAVREIRDAGLRAAELTRQMLIFSRRQPLRMTQIRLGDVVREAEPLLRQLMGDDVDVHLVIRDETGPIQADPSQIIHALMNLAVNSKDAMPEGGLFTVEVSKALFDESLSQSHPGIPPATYAQLCVSDTGKGMTEEVKHRLFEPFFTTKEVGEGPGMGLPAVYGMMKQFGGHILVYSEIGRGSVFKLLFPVSADRS